MSIKPLLMEEGVKPKDIIRQMDQLLQQFNELIRIIDIDLQKNKVNLNALAFKDGDGKQDYFEVLPVEILKEILKYLPTKELLRNQRLNKRTKGIIKDLIEPGLPLIFTVKESKDNFLMAIKPTSISKEEGVDMFIINRQINKDIVSRINF